MATQYSNKPIVTDGLVYALDFGNPKSYVSGSATANSLVYNPVPATFSTVPAGDYQGIAAAYSVRKVVSGYTGSAMMVQSASVSQSIGFDADGNLDTASLASFAGSGDAFVKIWFDQSGNGRNAVQNTYDSQPKIVSTGTVITLNNKPSIENSSGKQLVIAAEDVFRLDFSTFVVNPTNTNINSTLFRQTYQTSTLIRCWTNGGRWRENGEITYNETNTTLIQTQISAVGKFEIFKNSILKASTSGIGPLNPESVPSYLLNSGFNEFFGGKCSEAIFYSTDQSSNRLRIEENINSYYNIYSPLPSSPIPGLTSGFANFVSPDALLTNQTFNGFSYDRGNSTIMYVGETKGTSSLFTQDTNMSVVSTTSSVGFGSTSNNLGRTYPVNGLKHVTLRFSSGSVDCFVNGVPVPANSIFPTGSSVAGGKFAIPVYTGSLGLVQVYNRPLTGDEIWNNYQLAAPRYELGPLQNKPYNLDENAYLFLQSAGITDPIITSSIDTFVRGLKSNNLWDKMIAIYPFVGTGSDGTNLTGSHRWNLKEPSLVTYPLSFTGSWIGSTSGSAPSGSNTNISVNGITPSQYYPFFNTQSAHISILSYDTPVSSSYLMGTGMTEELAISTLAGDYGTPAAAYSVRKVRTAYSGALMDVRRSIDNVTSSIGFVLNGDLDTGSLLDWVVPGRSTLPGAYSGLAAAYSLRRVSASYSGDAIEVRRDSDNGQLDILFDSTGSINTSYLLNFVKGSQNQISNSEDFTGYVKTNTTVTSSAILGPDGLSSGSLINETANPGPHYINPGTILFSNPTSFTVSAYVKKNTRQYVGVGSIIRTADAAIAQFDLDAGTVVYLGSGSDLSHVPTTASITPENDGWYRIAVTIDFNTSGGDRTYPVFFNADEQFTSGTTYGNEYVGNPDSGSYLWGFQVVESNVLTDYVSTGGSAAPTNPTASGFVSTWYDQSGNGRHATQTTASSQPLIVSAGSLITENGKPALRFDSDFFDISPINVSNQAIFFVFNNTSSITAATPGTGILTGPNGGFNFGSSTGLVANERVYWSKQVPTVGVAENTTDIPSGSHVLSLLYDTSSLASMHRDGLEYTLVPNSNGPFTETQYPSGYNRIGGGNSNAFELIVYSANQSANRPLIENNINNYYNIYTGSNHGFVARWYDQSGNNRHATQTATGSQPIIVESGSVITDNNRSALTFDGNNFLPFNGSALANTKYSIFFAHSRNFSGPNYILGGNGGTNANLHVGYNGSTSYLLAQYFNDLSGSIPAYTSPILQQFSLINGNSGKAIYYNSSLIASNSDTVNLISYNGSAIGQYFSTLYNGKISEIVIYSSDLTSNREPIEYNINNYYNIYPQTSSFTTSSFTIKADSTSISGSLNNKLTSGIQSSGPLGLVTVSRTGSNSLTIARNGSTTSFSVPASGALSTGIYLGAINNNGLALGNSPLNISFASVGTGLSNNQIVTYSNLVNTLKFNVNGINQAEYINVLLYAANLGYILPSMRVQIAQNRLISDLKAAGIWSKLDTFAVFATDGDSDFALIDWKRLTQYTAVNSPTFTPNQGFEADNISAYVDANFIIGTNTSNATQNDMAFGGYNYSGSSCFGLISGAQVRIRFDNGDSRINSFTGNNYVGLMTTGFAALNRTNSNTKIAYMNGTQVGLNNADPSTLFNGSLTWGRSNGAFGIGYASSLFLGASFDATENLNFSNAFNTYMTSI